MKRSPNGILTQERVRELFSYDAQTGVLSWNVRSTTDFSNTKDCKIFNTRCAGKKAGWVQAKGYRYVNIDGASYQVHRVIWLYVYGVWPDKVDHQNHDVDDNRLSNLRNVSHSENMRNMSISVRNSSGRIGIRFDPDRNKWTAQIGRDGTSFHLGRFDTEVEALAARKAGERLLGFHKNHGRRQS